MPTRKRVSKALVVEAALASLLSPDGADRLEAALARRLDRMIAADRAARAPCHDHQRSAGALRSLLADQHAAAARHRQAAAQTKGRERYEGFVEALGRRLARGRTLADEVVSDVAAESDSDAGGKRVRSDRSVRLSFYPAALSTSRSLLPSTADLLF